MNEEEIRWIVNNLFIGNKLAQGEARLGPGRYFDLQVDQAADHRVRVDGRQHHAAAAGVQLDRRCLLPDRGDQGHGQTIVGLIHEDVGHLGIFVSGKVAKKEHAQIVSVLKYIQALPPGLYGMEIEETISADGTVEYDVTFSERRLEDLDARCRSSIASTKSRSRRSQHCRS